MRNRLVVAGAVAAGVLGVVVALVALFPPVRQVPGPRAGLVVAGVVAVLGVSMLVLLHRTTAARWAAWFAVPAAALGAAWWWQPQSSFGWFAYAPLSSVVVEGSAGADLLLPTLVLLLGVLATTGVVALVGDESPVRVLAVVAAALTAPLWVVPGIRVTAYGASLSGELVTTRVTVVRTAALLLVLVIGSAVLLARRPAPGRATAYAIPAAGLSWVWWQTGAGATVGVALSGGTPGPGFSDLLPWLVTPVAESALVIVLWVLTFLGARVLVGRYRPPDSLPVSPSEP
ncbi:hypothetical protein [Cellulomonas sp. P5_E12]